MTRNQKIIVGACVVAVIVAVASMATISVEVDFPPAAGGAPVTPAQVALGGALGLALIGVALSIALAAVGGVIWVILRLVSKNAKTPPN